MTDKLDRIRQDIPSVQEYTFVNSAGASLVAQSVAQKIKKYFKEECELGGYKVMENRMKEFDNFYVQTARLINCQPQNIAFANHATDAFNKAVDSIEFKAGDVIITTDNDYVSNYMCFINLIQRQGVVVERIPSLESGDPDLHAFQAMMRKLRPKLVAITHIPTSNGMIQDVVAFGEICSDYDDCIYIVDACQSVGQIVVDVEKIKCDFLSATGRKYMRGPRGTGFLYASDKMLDAGMAPIGVDAWGASWDGPLDLSLKGDATRFENFERPYSAWYGYMHAIQEINEIGIDWIEKRNMELSAHLRNGLTAIQDVVMLDQGSAKGAIVTFYKKGLSKDRTVELLDEHKVLYSLAQKFSAYIDFENKGRDWAVRFSPHYFNTLDEVDYLINLVAALK